MRTSLKVGIVAAVVAMSLAAASRASAQIVPYIWEVKANEDDRTLSWMRGGAASAPAERHPWLESLA